MKNSRLIIGLYQIIGSVVSLLAIGRINSAYGPVAAALLILFTILAVSAGVALWRGEKNRWLLTILNQLVQLVGFYTPVFAYNVIHGAGLTLGTRYFAAEKFAEANFQTSGQLVLGSSVFDVLWGNKLTGMPDYGLSVNFLALGILIYVAFFRPKAAPSQ